MQNINFFESLININVQVRDREELVISCHGKTLYNGDVETCKCKIRQVISDLSDKIDYMKKNGFSSKKKVIFNIQNYGTSGQSDIIYNNILDLKRFLLMLRSFAKCNIEVRTSYHNFG